MIIYKRSWHYKFNEFASNAIIFTTRIPLEAQTSFGYILGTVWNALMLLIFSTIVLIGVEGTGVSVTKLLFPSLIDSIVSPWVVMLAVLLIGIVFISSVCLVVVIIVFRDDLPILKEIPCVKEVLNIIHKSFSTVKYK